MVSALTVVEGEEYTTRLVTDLGRPYWKHLSLSDLPTTTTLVPTTGKSVFSYFYYHDYVSILLLM